LDSYSKNIDQRLTHQEILAQLDETNQPDKTRIGDVFSNPQLDIGIGSEDPTMSAYYPRARSLTWNLQRIEAVMRADPFFTRALEFRSTRPLQNGIDISSDEMETDRIADLQKKIESKINIPLQEGLYESDAFGWSALLIVIDGQNNKDAYRRPLRMKDIKEGKFLGLKPLTRWYQINQGNEFINELGERHNIYDPSLLGTPLYYKVSFDGSKENIMTVHRTRLIIIPRNRLSYIEEKIEHYGGTSILEQGFESLSRYHALVGQIHRILQKSVVPILKIDEMSSSALQTEKAQNMLEQKISNMRKNLDSNNMLVIGDSDSLTFEQAELAGLSDQLREARIQVSSAFNTPPHELFFEKMNYDTQEVYDFIRSRQKFKVKPIYEKLLPILYKSEYGEEIPEDYTITFKPLENPTMKELAEARKTNVEAVDTIYKIGGYNLKSLVDTLSDIDNNPSDIFRNVDTDYIKYIEELGAQYNYKASEIELAEALNKSGENTSEERSDGRSQGGDPDSARKPTPRPKVKKDNEE